MKDITNNNNIQSTRELAIRDKELLIKKNKSDFSGIGNQNNTECGIENPCKFGEHNSKFRGYGN